MKSEPIYFGYDEGREPDYSCLTAARRTMVGDVEGTEIVDVLFLPPHGGPFDVENERVS